MSELSRLVRAAQSEHRLPSVGARVVVRGEAVLELAVGVADDVDGREATPEMQYRVGSITKTFTAAAVMTLVDEGKVGLDERLAAYVTAAGERPLTIRRLLAHASGLQREPAGHVWETFEFPTVAELLGSLDQAEQVLEPGAHWHYSNLAYALLGEVVAERPARRMRLRRGTAARAGRARADGFRPDGTGRARLLRRPVLGRAPARGPPAPDRRRLGCRRPLVDDGRPLLLGRVAREREPMHAVQTMADVTTGWPPGLSA